MHRETSRELVTYQFDSLPVECLSHTVFTRLGGISRPPFATLNVGNSVGDDPAATAENHARIYQHMRIQADQVVTGQQVHGNHVVAVTPQDRGRVCPKTDALVTAFPNLALMLRFADCQPILLYDPARHALGLIHAGWRGLAQGVVRRAIETMRRTFGSDPRDLVAALGPAIGPCCYEVGDNVATAMGYVLPNWRRVMQRDGSKWRLDLPAANAQQLADTGVAHIEEAGICTSCHNDEFYSHRAENGVTGRFAVVAYLHARLADREDPLPISYMPAEESAEARIPDSIHPHGFPPFGDSAPRATHAEDGLEATT